MQLKTKYVKDTGKKYPKIENYIRKTLEEKFKSLYIDIHSTYVVLVITLGNFLQFLFVAKKPQKNIQIKQNDSKMF